MRYTSVSDATGNVASLVSVSEQPLSVKFIRTLTVFPWSSDVRR